MSGAHRLPAARGQVCPLRVRRRRLVVHAAAAWLGAAAVAGAGCGGFEPQPQHWRLAASVGTSARPGDLLLAERGAWIAREALDQNGKPAIEIVRLDAGARSEVIASFAGRAPALVELGNGDLLAVYVDDSGVFRARRASPDARRWSAPHTLAGFPNGATGHIARTRGGRLLTAISRAQEPRIVLHASDDEGETWTVTGAIEMAGAADAVLAELPAGNVLCVFRNRSQLHQCVSQDAGRTWGEPEPLGLACAAAPLALLPLPGGESTALLWTAVEPDSSRAPPGGQALRVALGRGNTPRWDPPRTVVLRPGAQLLAWRLAGRRGRVGTLFEERSDSTRTLVCWIEPAEAWVARAAGNAATDARERYGLSPRQARAALRVLAAHTVARPRRAHWLFVEAYFMRGLVAAHSCLAPFGSDEDAWIDLQAPLRQAIALADSLAAAQTAIGYWHTGYSGTYVADMASAAALFVALDPAVDATRRARYLQAAERFVQALERDGMFLRSGALGIGWRSPLDALLDAHARSSVMPGWRSPYLVSTALAGVELHAWLGHHLGNPMYRDRARAALEFTLSQLQPDGSLPPFAPFEGPLLTAAYVEEGWMAAAALINEPDLSARLCHRLAPHVAWLLRTQRADGTWDSGAAGEFARTPPILDFLVWYDRRCESRPEVRQAVQRGGAAWIDLDAQEARGVFRADADHEVLRAVLGRTLAALATEQPVE